MKNVKIMRAIKSRMARYFGYIIYRSVVYMLNATPSPFLIEYKPDGHYIFGKPASYDAAFHAWTHKNLTNNAGDISRLYMLMMNIDAVLDTGVVGDLAEVGVYKGNSAALLARMARKRHRRTYLFDTFQGFDERDIKGVDSNVRPAFSDTSLESVKKLVGEEDVFFIKGFYPESANQIKLPRHFAVVHIDCDLYEPIRAALENFYPLMSPSGLIIVHDYSSGHWPGAAQAVDEFFADKPEKPVLIPDKSGSVIVRIRSDKT